MKILKSLIFVAAVGLAMPTLAADPKDVAKLSKSGGTVMVDHGKGFVTTKVDALLFENDRVITLDGSMAEITFNDGCRTTLKSNNMIVISIDPGCKAAIVDASGAASATQVAGGHGIGEYIPLIGAGYIIIKAISIESHVRQ